MGSEVKKVLALRKLARIEEVVLGIIDMEFSYNSTIGIGAHNAFKAMLHLAYLCMKVPSNQGIIWVHGIQEAARRAEGTWVELKAIHNFNEAKAQAQNK